MIVTKNAGTAIKGTSMIQMTPRNMADVETIDVKGTKISGGIRSEVFSADKNVERQREIATQYGHQITGKQKTTAE